MQIRHLMQALQDDHSACSRELLELYGPRDFHRQQERYLSALRIFHERHPDTPRVLLARAPGRVTIAGQHCDYNHGHIVNFPIIQDTLLVAGPREDSLVVVSNMDAAYPRASFGSANVGVRSRKAAALHWTDYLQALHFHLNSIARRNGSSLSGMNLLVDGRPEYGSVPIAVGLGSSAALLVASGIVVAELAHPPLQLSSSQLATAAMQSENSLGFPSGLQDPMGSLAGELGPPYVNRQAIVIDPIPREYRGEALVIVKPVPIPEGINVFLLHTGSRKGEDAWLEFNVRADEARLGSFLLAGWLRSMYPRILESTSLLHRAYPDVVHPDLPTYPPFYKPFYFCVLELSRVGVSISPRMLVGWSVDCPAALIENNWKHWGCRSRFSTSSRSGAGEQGWRSTGGFSTCKAACGTSSPNRPASLRQLGPCGPMTQPCLGESRTIS